MAVRRIRSASGSDPSKQARLAAVTTGWRLMVVRPVAGPSINPTLRSPCTASSTSCRGLLAATVRPNRKAADSDSNMPIGIEVGA
jgi:hypothetical protein